MIKIDYKRIKWNRDTYKIISYIRDYIPEKDQIKADNNENADTSAQIIIKSAIKHLKKSCPLRYRFILKIKYTIGDMRGFSAGNYLFDLVDHSDGLREDWELLDGLNIYNDLCRIWAPNTPEAQAERERFFELLRRQTCQKMNCKNS